MPVGIDEVAEKAGLSLDQHGSTISKLEPIGLSEPPEAGRGTYTQGALYMSRYMPMTGVDFLIPAMMIDTHAPLQVLQETADFRIRTVTRLLEAIAHEPVAGEPIALLEVLRLAALVLRDGCDFLDVIGRRHRGETAI